MRCRGEGAVDGIGGYGSYLKNGKPVWLWNMVDLDRLKWEGTEPLSPDKYRWTLFPSTTAMGRAPSPASTMPTTSRRFC